MASTAKLQRGLMAILIMLLAAIGVILLTNHGVTTTPVASTTHSPFDGASMPTGLRAANFSLTDQSGRRVTLSRYRGHVVVLTFIHSLCHDTCPFMVEQIKGALNDLPGNGSGVPAIAVSADPSEDTVANRKAFLAKHEMLGRLAFLNGPERTMRRVWHAYGIQPVTPKIDHSTFVFLIDKRGLERVGFGADELTPEGLAHDIRVLERQPS